MRFEILTVHPQQARGKKQVMFLFIDVEHVFVFFVGWRQKHTGLYSLVGDKMTTNHRNSEVVLYIWATCSIRLHSIDIKAIGPSSGTEMPFRRFVCKNYDFFCAVSARTVQMAILIQTLGRRRRRSGAATGLNYGARWCNSEVEC